MNPKSVAEMERIVAAAIRQDGVVFTGTRHAFIMRDIALTTGAKQVTGQQGFVTSKGDFVSREIARDIALRAGQLPLGSINQRQLFSEDVWDIPSLPERDESSSTRGEEEKLLREVRDWMNRAQEHFEYADDITDVLYDDLLTLRGKVNNHLTASTPAAPERNTGLLLSAAKQLEECQCAGSAGSKRNSNLADRLRQLASRVSSDAPSVSSPKRFRSAAEEIILFNTFKALGAIPSSVAVAAGQEEGEWTAERVQNELLKGYGARTPIEAYQNLADQINASLREKEEAKSECGHLARYSTKGSLFPKHCLACELAEVKARLAADPEPSEQKATQAPQMALQFLSKQADVRICRTPVVGEWVVIDLVENKELGRGDTLVSALLSENVTKSSGGGGGFVPKSFVLTGEWRHSHGQLFCGTLRIARADFDTAPTDEFKKAVFDDICSAMNAPESSSAGGASLK